MLKFNNLQIYIQQNFHRNSIEMWLTDIEGPRQFNISYNGEGKLERTEIDEMQAITADEILKPFLNLPASFAKVLFQKIAEYNDKYGVKTVDQNLLEGKLMAKEEHLKDMREFAKKLLDASLSVR